MPRGRRFFWNKKKTAVPIVKQQCCVVCYTEFYPYPTTPSKWESAITRMFYSALDIPPLKCGGGGGDDDDEEQEEIVSLPYCPQCHNKISIMFNLHCQLESIQHQFDCVRNEIAFLVVETIDKNSKQGPLDFIRQQIFEKWRHYHEELSKENYHDKVGLDAMFFGSHGSLSLSTTTTNVNHESKSNNLNTNRKAENENNNMNNIKEEEEEESTVQEYINDEDTSQKQNKNCNDKFQYYNDQKGQSDTHHHLREDDHYHNVTSLMKVEMKDETEYSDQEEEAEDEQQQYQHNIHGNNNETLAPNSLYTTNSYRGRGRRRGRKFGSNNNNMPRLIPVSQVYNMTRGGEYSATSSARYNSIPVTRRRRGRGNHFTRGNMRGRVSNFTMTRLPPQDNIEQPEDEFLLNMTNNNNNNKDSNQSIQTRTRTRRGGGGGSSLISRNVSKEELNVEFSRLPQIQQSQLVDDDSLIRKRGRPRKRLQDDESPMQHQLPAIHYSPTIKKMKQNPSLDEQSGQYPCLLCPKMFDDVSQLLRHESNYHPNLKSIHCDTCGRGFSSRLTLRRHKVNIHKVLGDKAKKCPVCGKTFIKQHTFDFHMQTHKDRTGGIDFKKNLSVSTTTSSGNVNSSNNNAGIPKSSEVSNNLSRTPSISTIKSPVINGQNEITTTSSKTSTTTTNTTSIINSSNTKKTPPTSSSTSVAVKPKLSLSSTKTRSMISTLSNNMNTLSNKHNMDTDIQRKGTKLLRLPSTNELTCKVCKRVFPYTALLKLHSLTHTKKSCNTCKMLFDTDGQLAKHMETNHSKAAQLMPCPVCEKLFTRSDVLNRHIKTHSMNSEPDTLDKKVETTKVPYDDDADDDNPTSSVLNGTKPNNEDNKED